MASERAALGPYRETALLKKWEGRPQEGEPDEVIERHWHYEADHTLVTDPERIKAIDDMLSVHAGETAHLKEEERPCH